MKTNYPNLLPEIHINIDDANPYSREEMQRLIEHDSLKVYYQISSTNCVDYKIAELSTTTARSNIILPIIEDVAQRQTGELSVIDLACSPGYFMFKLAQLGFNNITGVDAREDHYKQFKFLNEQYRYKNINFIHSDVYEFLDAEIEKGNKYDICLLFGFLYHTSTPVELLRKIKRICSQVLIVDTTLSHKDDMSLDIYEERIAWSRASTSVISFNPSLLAVPKILEAAGFRNIERIMPPVGQMAGNPGGPNIDYFFDNKKFSNSRSLIQRIKNKLFPSQNIARKRPDRRALFKAYV